MVAPDVATGQNAMVGPQMMYPSNPSPQEAQAWSSVQNVVGDTPSKFLQMLGATPEERQQNAKLFADTLEKINGAFGNLSQSTLGQRLTEEKIRSERMKAIPAPGTPLPADPIDQITPSMIAALQQTIAATQAGIASRSRWQR